MPRSNRHGKLMVSGKSPADMVTEALMTELKYQLNVAHQQHLQRLEVERRQKFGVDYSWLASNDSPVRRPYELPEMKRIELEQMCGRICPSDCGRVLITFRQLIADQETPKAEEIPQLLRATVSQVLSQCPATSSAKHDARLLRQRLTRSLSNIRLRPSSRVSVAPLSIEEDTDSTSTASTMSSCNASSIIPKSLAAANTPPSSASRMMAPSGCGRSQSADDLTVDFGQTTIT